MPHEVEGEAVVKRCRDGHSEDERQQDLATVEIPVVCTYGARSPNSMFRLTQSLAAAIPTARTHQVEGAGHAVAFDAPANFVRLIADTINSLEAVALGARGAR